MGFDGKQILNRLCGRRNNAIKQYKYTKKLCRKFIDENFFKECRVWANDLLVRKCDIKSAEKEMIEWCMTLFSGPLPESEQQIPMRPFPSDFEQWKLAISNI